MISIFEFASKKEHHLTSAQESYLMNKFAKKEIFIYIPDKEKMEADELYKEYCLFFNIDKNK